MKPENRAVLWLLATVFIPLITIGTVVLLLEPSVLAGVLGIGAPLGIAWFCFNRAVNATRS